MDEKTEELRDIFLSVADEEAVTESQTDERGSLTDGSDAVETRLREVVEQLEGKFGFDHELSDSKRCRVIEGFYEGETDEEIADAIERDPGTVFDARMDLHLIREEEPTLDDEAVAVIREQPDADATDLTDSDVTAEEMQRARAVLDAEERSRRVSHRFRTAFEEILTDVELTDRLAADAQDDGLADATEGAETDVEL